MIIQNYSLKKHNTLGLDANARFFTTPHDENQLRKVLSENRFRNIPLLVLGSGSNILFSNDFDGLVVRLEINDISVTGDDDKSVYVRAGAGINWDNLVSFCTDRGWGGAENLSWIPGTVGASPVQNIGAYGSEVKDIIYSVEYLERESLNKVTLKGSECKFGYRDSIFKRELKSTAIITYVTFRLKKFPDLNTGYADISAYFNQRSCKSINDIREAVIAIRKDKLPDPSVTGNAGSFFKNPVVKIEKAEELKNLYPSLKIYPAGEGMCKLPAAWLIDQCGFKGKRFGNVGVHEKQPLVLLAYKGAVAAELLELSSLIIREVRGKFGIEISPEVNIF
ncbi:MAG: UDP-N-acetylmuramate dehydrogenase [Bacteroidales bacterium]|nr:UDP-N-acetylmuramate dehydrogenase [Bacteroidales bacterium]MDD2425065.1 UDP-N-acetylmuramate dehydrogenase [Bacteroidales bacterium]MDD3988626.1 UDP-N-acetylmuramate dehydrogenase [Bacteroidales bacterium]